MDDSTSRTQSRRDLYFEHVPTLLACLNDAGELLRLNARWDGRLGWSREELEGRDLHTLLSEQDAGLCSQALLRASAGEEVELELALRTRFGTWQLQRWSVRHEPQSQLYFARVEELDGVQRLAPSIYARLELDTGLFPEELVYFVGAFKRQVYTILSPDGSIRYESPGVRALTGWEAEDLVGRPSFDFIHPEDLPAAVEVISRLASGPVNEPPMVYRFRRRDGGWAWLESDGVTIYREGVIHSIVLVSREVSAQRNEREQSAARIRELEQALVEQRALLTQAQAAAQRAAWAEEVVRSSNSSYIGWALLRQMGDRWSMLGGNGRIEPWGEVREGGVVVLSEPAQRICVRSLEAQRIVREEVVLGQTRSQLIGCPGSGQDVMILVDRPEEVAEVSLSADSSQEVSVGLTDSARRALLHELRTPINAILGYTELLEEEVDRAHHGDLRRIRLSARAAGAMLAGLLESWRAQAPGRALAMERLTLEPALVEWRELMSVIAPQQALAGLRVDSEVQAVYTDPHKLKQGLLAMGYGASRVGRLLGLEVSWQGRQSVCFVVHASEASAARLEDEQRGALRILGLGLAQRLSEELGGRLEILVEGTSARVILTLPQRVSASSEFVAHRGPDMNRDVALDPETLEELSEAQDEQDAVVLVIEDNEESQTYLARALRRHPYHVLFAGDGLQGLSMARQLLPAVIILDVVMPTLDGWSVLAQLKQEPALAHIPVIVHSVIEDPELARQLGAAESLSKPAPRDALLAALERLCRRTKTPSRGMQSVDEGLP
jgi:PAS domain S-box-containing protein